MAPLENAVPSTGLLITRDAHVHIDEKADYEHIQHIAAKEDGSDALPVTIPTSEYSSIPPWQAISKFRRQFLFGCAASLGALYIGYCNAAVGNIVANPGFIAQFGQEFDGEMALVAKEVAAWGAVQQCGQIFTQFTSPWVIDRFGRKSVMYLLATFMGLSIIVGIIAKDWRVYLVAKLFAGMACGCLGTAVMTYLSEISLPNYRGILLSIFSWMMSIGGFTNAVACQIVVKTTPMAYRHVFYSEFLFLGFWIAAILYIPESHLWLISQGRMDQAKKAHRRLVGDMVNYDFEVEFEILRLEVVTSEAITAAYSGNGWWALLTKRENFLRCVIASLPFAAQQFSGVPYIFNYTTYFFQMGGLADPFLGNVIINIVYIIALVGSFFLIDKWGRRPLVVWGSVALGIFNLAIGGLGWLENGSTTSGAVLITFCCLWMLAYALTLAPTGWIGIVEVSSSKLRAKTAAFAVLVNSFLGLIFNYTTPLLLSDQGAGWNIKIGLFFGGLTFLFLIPIFFLYPETKGRSYAEIDELFQRKIKPRKFAETQTTHQLQQEEAVPGV